jgi:hypothetical protein
MFDGIRQLGQDNWYSTTLIGQPGYDSRDRSVWTCWPERSAGPFSLDKTESRRWPEHVSKGRAGTEQLGQDNCGRTASTDSKERIPQDRNSWQVRLDRQRGQNAQHMTARTWKLGIQDKTPGTAQMDRTFRTWQHEKDIVERKTGGQKLWERQPVQDRCDRSAGEDSWDRTTVAG